MNLQKYQCGRCGYVYNPEEGDENIQAWISFKNLPVDRVCPVCGASQNRFSPIDIEQNIITKSRINNIDKLTENVIELEIQTDQNLDYIPGQYLNFVMEDSEGKFIREYSIVSSNDKKYKFLIKLEKTGRASDIFRWLLEDFESLEIPILSVQGEFVLQDTDNPKVFIATSTGLAPIYRQILSLNDLENAQLLWGNRNYKNMFYLDKLNQFDWLDKHFFLSREDRQDFYYGRIDIDKFDWDESTEFYLCGNPNMVQDISTQLESRGFENIYYEKFVV